MEEGMGRMNENSEKLLSYLKAMTSEATQKLMFDAAPNSTISETLANIGFTGLKVRSSYIDPADPNKIIVNLGLDIETCLKLIQHGLMCPYCYALDMKPVAEGDIKAINQGYYPSQIIQCGKCRQYVEKDLLRDSN